MTVRSRAPVAGLLVYAALGVALGMVVWALVLHGDGTTSDRPGEPSIFDKQASERRHAPPQGDDR